MASLSVARAGLKNLLRPTYARVRRSRWFRRLATSNYRCGKLAFGERNTYLATPPGWMTVDLEDADVNVDLTRHEPLPLPDGSQDVIYTAHMVEHIDEETLVFFLKEAHRLLKAGGAVRIEAPDIEILVGEYRKKTNSEVLQYFADDLKVNIVQKLGYPPEYAEKHIALISFISCYVENGRHIPVYATRAEVDAKLDSLDLEAFGQWCVSLQTPEQQRTHGHVNPLYFDKLRRLLLECGFRDVTRMPNGRTTIKGLDLTGIERRQRAAFSFYVDAYK